MQIRTVIEILKLMMIMDNKFHRAAFRLGALWAISSATAAAPLSGTAYFGPHFYGNNGVCLSLHIHDPYAKVSDFGQEIIVWRPIWQISKSPQCKFQIYLFNAKDTSLSLFWWLLLDGLFFPHFFFVSLPKRKKKFQLKFLISSTYFTWCSNFFPSSVINKQ